MKILLVEDDDRAASVLKNTLTEHHYLVDLATDGQAGLSLAEAFAYNLVRRSRAKSIWGAAIADLPQ